MQSGITTQKVQNSIIMFVAVSSDDAKNYDELFLENYIKINLIPQVQRVPGVGHALVFGAKDYSMRIWLKPDRLTANNLSPQDVLSAIRDQNMEAAPGRLGQSSPEAFEYVLKYKGKSTRNEDYENFVIKANNDGSMLRLKDGRVLSLARLPIHPTAGWMENRYQALVFFKLLVLMQTIYSPRWRSCWINFLLNFRGA